jgi:predicted MPP superfamily phosphohydrolase
MPPDAVTYGLNPDKDGHRNVWISSGLAAKQDRYASFRLFNPPEIAVLTLSAMP